MPQANSNLWFHQNLSFRPSRYLNKVCQFPYSATFFFDQAAKCSTLPSSPALLSVLLGESERGRTTGHSKTLFLVSSPSPLDKHVGGIGHSRRTGNTGTKRLGLERRRPSSAIAKGISRHGIVFDLIATDSLFPRDGPAKRASQMNLYRTYSPEFPGPALPCSVATNPPRESIAH
jgi:hypothetical protein